MPEIEPQIRLTEDVTIYRGYSLRKRGKKWRFWNGQKQVDSASIETAKQAIDELHSRQDHAERIAQVPILSVADALLKWSENAKLKNLDHTTIRGTLTTWKKIVPSLKIHDVTKDLVLSLINLEKYADASKRTMLFHIRSVLSFCKLNKIIIDESIYTIPLPTNQNCKKKNIISDEQRDNFLKHLQDRDWRLYQLAMCMSVWGIRPDNITEIKKEDYNKEAQTVTVKGNTSKNRKVILLPVTKDIECLIEKAVKENQNDYLFNSSDGKKWSVDGVQSLIKRAKDANILPQDMSWYSFRLKKDKEYIERGLNPYDHAALMGHSPTTIARSYYRTDMNKVISQITDKIYFKYFDGTKEHKFENINDLIKFYREQTKKN